MSITEFKTVKNAIDAAARAGADCLEWRIKLNEDGTWPKPVRECIKILKSEGYDVGFSERNDRKYASLYIMVDGPKKGGEHD